MRIERDDETIPEFSSGSQVISTLIRQSTGVVLMEQTCKTSKALDCEIDYVCYMLLNSLRWKVIVFSRQVNKFIF